MSEMIAHQDIVYSAPGLTFRIIKKGNELIFIGKDGEEIEKSSLSDHMLNILARLRDEPYVPDMEDEDSEEGEESQEPETPEEPVEPEVTPVAFGDVEAGIDNDGNVFLTVAYTGDAESVKVHHSYDKYFNENEATELPWFKLYADADVWGDSSSAAQAQGAGVEAEWEEGLFTFRILEGGMVYQAIEAAGVEMVFHPRLVNLDKTETSAEVAASGFPA